MKATRLAASAAGLVMLSAWASIGQAAEQKLKISVDAGKHDRKNVPVRTLVELPADLAKATTATLTDDAGNTIPGQLTSPGLLSTANENKSGSQRELHFVVPQLKARQKATYTATISDNGSASAGSFAWNDTPGKYTELAFGGKGGRPVLRYVYQAFDDSTPERRYETYKVFHHLYDPAGKRIVTNGPTVDQPYGKVRYPHHRAIYYGFSKMSYEGVPKADLWHCQGDNYQSHEGVQTSDAGPVVGRHTVAIDWHGKGKKTFAKEQRELTVYNVPGGQLVEFASKLASEVGKLKIDGDPQHAGFQFRAHNDVAAKNAKQTYYLRVDGVGKPGETRNWPGDKTQVDFPWKGMSFVLGDARYTIAYLDRPTNPKEARFSERDYGRFGSYFVSEIDGDQTLDVNYRLWLQDGEMTTDQIAALSNDFVDPPKVTVSAK